ncbi:MAG: DUF4935 domain-containing protein [Alphaproteobacteria bacterium]|nr:DUF4935 domain-containing protein [Alphaproteobacteria bacterium]MBP7757915.1 DUF4935 domain-containing protein [Alphaproteobacteria bacterium]MBP7761242.1 DUF4935 domain-containing protein [Alphaproteobacteria bacterium]MBP7904813.1 DUF4935 domain-containing protein [Alphaproteobacteria bacterium]
MRSASAQAFFKACALLHIECVIPEIVIDEAKGNYPKKLDEKVKSFLKAQRDLTKLVKLDAKNFVFSDAVEEFEDWLDNLIEEYEITVAPYPEISAKELVKKSYENKKPFKDTGEGHKDYVVWRSVKSHIEGQTTTPPNIFLTNNTKDFCTQSNEGNPILHPELAEQIAEEARRPRVLTSIKAGFDQVLAPNLEGITLEELPNLAAHDIESMTGEYLLKDLPQRTAYGFEGVPFSNDISISAVGAHQIKNISLKKVDDEVIINISGGVDIEVFGFIDKHAYYHDDEDGIDVCIVDADWNDHVMAVSASVETDFELTIFYSIENNEVVGYEIDLPLEIDDGWPYK